MLQGSTALTFARYNLNISLYRALMLVPFVSNETRLKMESVHIRYVF
ncbi:Protein quail neuroretina 1 [Gossypium arboreum]|uniref:Protein quail neuroretina 1 n=1 Tax=Gossypium arboreum TaxID=29729 RepID=A0A0B0N7V2_GOSAR|nr:Protein quail neuroretina 1 [Gossypium arboreum]